MAAASALIERVWTDKAQYRLDDEVAVYVQLRNTTGAAWTGNVFAKPRFLGRPLALDQQQPLTIANGATRTLTFTFAPHSLVNRGYLVGVTCVRNDGVVTDAGSTAYDVSDDWTKFPRYGFLTQFNYYTVAADLLDPLRDYKINAIQYYDWMDEHHIPYRSGHDFWQDIAARDPWVSKAKLNELIALGHSYNMAALAYDLMYGAYDNYLPGSGVSLSWGAFTVPRAGGSYTQGDQDRHELNILGWETPCIYIFNPASEGWRDWMAQQFQQVYADIGFDGWHIDTLGNRGQLYAFDGTPLDMAANYAGFVNDMRDQLGSAKYLVVNTVSNYGLSQVIQNADVDVLYSERWGGVNEDEFFDLKLMLDGVRASTSTQAVIAGYMNYNTAQMHSPENPGTFNEPAILLADAAIFANGGWHIELGDGLNMLSNEYFPHKSMVLSAATQAKLLEYYKFAVAYENLLRDGVVDGEKRIEFDPGGATPSGYNAAAGAVWKVSGYRPGFGCGGYYDSAHLINLTSVGSTLWRDPDSTSAVPAEITNKPVRLYYNGPWNGTTVWFASPDYDGGRAAEVTEYTRVFDPGQSQWYVEFTLPKLHYWTMIWLERRPAGVGDMNCDGSVDFADINPFVRYLSDFVGWQSTYPGCSPANGDIDGDGSYPSLGDINPFVVLLTGGA